MSRGKPTTQCVTRGCSGQQFSKGICRKCYNAAQSLIGRNLTTWEELEALGLIQENTGAKFMQLFNMRTKGRLDPAGQKAYRQKLLEDQDARRHKKTKDSDES